jgi:hypothetical protein
MYPSSPYQSWIIITTPRAVAAPIANCLFITAPFLRITRLRTHHSSRTLYERRLIHTLGISTPLRMQ